LVIVAVNEIVLAGKTSNKKPRKAGEVLPTEYTEYTEIRWA
jgi:hypothetical protein